MAADFIQFFQELLYGEGLVFGLIIIIAIVALITKENKYAALLFLPVTGFLAIDYMNRISTSSNWFFASVIMWSLTIFLPIQLWTRSKHT